MSASATTRFSFPFLLYQNVLYQNLNNMYGELFVELLKRKLGVGQIYGLKKPEHTKNPYTQHFILKVDDHTYIDGRGIFSSVEELKNEPMYEDTYKMVEMTDYVLVKEDGLTDEQLKSGYSNAHIEYVHFFIDLLLEKHASLKQLCSSSPSSS